MLNYLSAELYKLRHKKSLYISVAALLALESLLFVPNFWVDEEPLRGVLLGFLDALLPMGFFLAPVFAVLSFDNQHGHETLKNEVVFGIPRRHIYLGKLLAGMSVGTLAAAIVIGWYLLLCTLTAGLPFGTRLWEQLLINVASAWLCWLAAVAFTMLLLFTLRSSAGAMVLTYLIALVGVPIGIIGANPDPNYGPAPWIKALVNLFYSAPFKRFWFWFGEIYPPGFEPPLDWGPLWYALIVCALWVGLTSVLGVLLFRRREIK